MTDTIAVDFAWYFAMLNIGKKLIYNFIYNISDPFYNFAVDQMNKICSQYFIDDVAIIPKLSIEIDRFYSYPSLENFSNILYISKLISTIDVKQQSYVYDTLVRFINTFEFALFLRNNNYRLWSILLQKCLEPYYL